MASGRNTRGRPITIRRYSSAAEADRHDLEYWLQIPERERVLQCWRLSEELWRLRGEFPNEPGLFHMLTGPHPRSPRSARTLAQRGPQALSIALRAFIAAKVRFLIVGAYALALHGRPRATGDLDVWVEAAPENAARVLQALREFGAPLADISEADFASPGVVYQVGVAPRRIDILTELTGLTFAEAWTDRLRRPFGDVEVDFIGRASFIRNKRATGRPKDLGDIEGME